MGVYWNSQLSLSLSVQLLLFEFFVKVFGFVIIDIVYPFVTSGSIVLIYRAKALLVLCDFASLPVIEALLAI